VDVGYVFSPDQRELKKKVANVFILSGQGFVEDGYLTASLPPQDA